MRFFGSVVAMLMLVVGCGSDASKDLVTELAEANEEILELENRVEELIEWEFGLREDLSTSTERLSKKSRRELGQPFSSWNEPRHNLYSHGSCGSFVLDGGRLLQLEYDESYFAPPGEYWFNSVEDRFAFEDSIEWVDTGILLADGSKDFFPRWGSHSWRFEAPPDQVFSVEVDTGHNPFFWVKWFNDYSDWPPFPPPSLRSWSYAHGFFGVDRDCNWGWVPLVWAHLSDGDGTIDLDQEKNPGIQYVRDFKASGVTEQGIEVAEGGALKTFITEGGDSCTGISRDHDMGRAIAEYDPEQHLFVAHCVENHD